MASESKNPTEVHNQQYLMEVEGNGDRLRRSLEIHPPEDASRTPPILAFKRKREIDIPWDDIVSGAKDTGACAGVVREIRKYFEEPWGEMPEDEMLANDVLFSGERWLIKKIPTDEAKFYRLDLDQLDDQGKPTEKAMELTEGFVIRHLTSGRVYRLVAPEGSLSEEDFRSRSRLDEAWNKHIEGVELVFTSDAEALAYHMDFEEIDLRPALIQRKYRELAILRDFASKVKTKVEGVTDTMIEKITATTLDADQLEQLQRKVMRLEIGEFDVQRRIERLASDAARLGYYLCIREGDKVTIPGEPEKVLVLGQLYTTYTRTARWTEYVPTRVRRGWSIFSYTKTVKVARPREQVVLDYQPVDTSKNLLEEKRSALRQERYHVYVFDRTPDGLVSTEGEPLHQIMDRCGYDEAFRRACVVMLPVCEESLTGYRILAKYAIYKRPLPGMAPTILPRLSLEESLSYRTAWLGTQLGELVSTINLAPDEQRQVTITKRYEQETTSTRTSTSIFDVSSAETSDLSTEMANETRREQESSKSMEFSTKASGGYGPFSAEASASGGAKSSLKDVSQAISKVARKAAKSVSSQNRQEVSSATTSRTTVSNTDETVATIRNINQGRSLNLMFYRLYNKYKGGLYLEDLRFDVIPSVELISGSGVHESRSYSLEDLPDLINEFKDARLPFDVEDTEKYTDHLLDSIETLLSREYAVDSRADASPTAGQLLSAPSTPAEPRAAETSVAKVSFAPAREESPGQEDALLGSVGLDVESEGGSTLADLRERLRRTVILSDEPIAPQELLVAAPGLYLDAAVGAQPSTEPYSELMRDQEVKMRAAEVFAKRSEAVYQQAMAMRLAQMRVTDDANCLIGVLPGPDQKSLTLALRMPLLNGDWRLLVDNVKKEKVATPHMYRNIIAFSWDKQQKWLSEENLLSKIGLRNEKTGDTIIYPI